VADVDTIRIRTASKNDLSTVQRCAKLAYAKYMERMDKPPAPMSADFAKHIKLNQLYVAIYESQLAGYIVCFQEQQQLQIENVAVYPEFERRGIGKRLLNFAERLAYKLHLPAVQLYTNEAMTENLLMYPKLGYIETHRQQQAGFSRVFFRKEVQHDIL